jgi:hypothetical protein
MEDDLISVLNKFMQKEKIDLTISKDNLSEFWLDDILGSITVKFKVDIPSHEIFYDVYSPEYSVHLKEETLEDVKHLEYIAEENRQWKIAEIIEDIWLILDKIKLWAEKNNFRITEKKLV